MKVAKYRAVFLVPSIVEFECSGSHKAASKQAREIADSMGKAKSIHPRQLDAIYAPKVLEVVVVEDVAKPQLLRAG